MTVTVDAPGTAEAAPRAPQHFERSTLFLLANTALTGALGTGFWLLAARLAPEADVATAVAASSLLIALAFLAQCNLPTAVSRFLPAAGAGQRSLIRRSYAVAFCVAGAFTLGVLAVGAARGGAVVDGGDTLLTVTLAASIPVWAIFAMQDGVLVAARRSWVVPFENTVTTLAKFVLLPLLLVFGGAGIVAAWTLPALLAIPVVSFALFRRYLHPDDHPYPGGFGFVRYALQDLPGAALYLLSFRAVPLLVLEVGDHLDGAYIGLPWTILTVAALALPMLSRALLAELSHGDTDVDALMRRVTRLIGVVVLPATLVGALVVGPVLSFAGDAYEARGTRVLAFGVIGLAPAALVECRLALLRFRNQVRLTGLFQALRAVALLIGVAVLLGAERIEDIGLVFLGINVVAAAVAVPLTRTATRNPPSALRGWWVPVPGVIGLVVASVAVARAEVADIGRYGLIDAIGPLGTAGIAAVVFGTAASAGTRPWRPWLTYTHLAAVIMLLHGLPGLVEDHPRFGVAWLHSGFAGHIATDGTLLTSLDARFSWPGFFAGNALVQQVSESPDVLWMVRFAPVAISVLACTCIGLLGRAVGMPAAHRAVAMLVYLVFNWSGQDYFAPQATGFVLYLVVVTVLVTLFRSPSGEQPWWRRWMRAAPAPPAPPLSHASRVAVVGGVCAVSVVMVVTHQLSPGFLAASTLLLTLTDTVRVRALPWLIGAATIAWLAYGAEAYWLGHLTKLTDSVGDTTSLIGDNVGARAAGAVATRQHILFSRAGLALALWAIAALALAWAWHRRRTPVVLACLFAGPVPLFLLQPYGGEMLIRVYFFTVPPAALLVAHLVGARLWSVAWRSALALALAAVVPFFMLARFGNEEFEVVTDDAVELVDVVHDTVPTGATIFVANRQTLVHTGRVGEIRYQSLEITDVDAILARIATSTAAENYILLSASQEAFWEQFRSLPRGWMSDFARELVATGDVATVFHRGDSWLLRYEPDGRPA